MCYNLDGEDFSRTATNLTFVDGEAVKIFTVEVINDAVYETEEIFSATLTSFDSRVTIFHANADIHIKDNDGT